MNDFDFFTVEASSNRITPLMKLRKFRNFPNVKRSDIEHRVYYDATSKFPKNLYKLTLGYYDVMEFGHFGARERANEHIESMLATNPDNVMVSLKFWPRD